ncbi:hypothetical protein EST38_g2595 [Candolleomyces aberdarensis]|uniref:Uncharacterized protein n=1 Tax=Candolleomyces aberdarensis TaxID=2316362 RepID=A0A4Q2DS22_9AGAR|nr:hypothetical protein EST38_g2595 [Candolleomyces aberdarensis]
MASSIVDLEIVGKVAARAMYANITITLVPVGLFALTASLDAAWIFELLFQSTSGENFYIGVGSNLRVWERFLSVAALNAVIFIGDGILIYRCYIIWSHFPWVIIPPVLTFLAALVMSIFGIVVDIDQRIVAKFGPARTFLTILTNIMVTGLIALHLLYARKKLQKLFPSRDLQLYTGIVAILIESALPLTIFGIVYAIMSTVGLPKSTEPISQFLIAYYSICTLFFSFCVSALVDILHLLY